MTARCVQMDAAAASRAVLCERLPDGTTLLVMPGPADPDQAPPALTVDPGGWRDPGGPKASRLTRRPSATMTQDTVRGPRFASPFGPGRPGPGGLRPAGSPRRRRRRGPERLRQAHHGLAPGSRPGHARRAARVPDQDRAQRGPPDACGTRTAGGSIPARMPPGGPSRQHSFEDEIQAKEDLRLVWKAIGDMPDMRRGRGPSARRRLRVPEDIATRLGIKVSTVRSHISDARKQLSRTLPRGWEGA